MGYVMSEETYEALVSAAEDGAVKATEVLTQELDGAHRWLATSQDTWQQLNAAVKAVATLVTQLADGASLTLMAEHSVEVSAVQSVSTLVSTLTELTERVVAFSETAAKTREQAMRLCEQAYAVHAGIVGEDADDDGDDDESEGVPPKKTGPN